MEFVANVLVYRADSSTDYLAQVLMTDGAQQASKWFKDEKMAWDWAKEQAKKYNEI